MHDSSTSDISSYQLFSVVFSCFQLSRCFKVLDVSATEVVTSCGLRLQGPTTAAVRLRKAVDSLLQKGAGAGGAGAM